MYIMGGIIMKKNNGFVKFEGMPSPYYSNRRKKGEDTSTFVISKSLFGKLAVRVSKELTASESEMAAKLAGFKPVRLEVETCGKESRVSFVADTLSLEVNYYDFKSCFGKLESQIVRLMAKELLSG